MKIFSTALIFLSLQAFANVTEITGSFDTKEKKVQALEDHKMAYASFEPAEKSLRAPASIEEEKNPSPSFTEITGTFE